MATTRGIREITLTKERKMDMIDEDDVVYISDLTNLRSKLILPKMNHTITSMLHLIVPFPNQLENLELISIAVTHQSL